MHPIRRFHKRRRMFAIVAGDLLIAAPGDPRSHEEWLKSIGHSVAQHTRGYYLDGKLVAYRGDYFIGDEPVERDLLADGRLAEMANRMSINGPFEVYVGAVFSEPGQIWEPAKKLLDFEGVNA